MELVGQPRPVQRAIGQRIEIAGQIRPHSLIEFHLPLGQFHGEVFVQGVPGQAELPAEAGPEAEVVGGCRGQVQHPARHIQVAAVHAGLIGDGVEPTVGLLVPVEAGERFQIDPSAAAATAFHQHPRVALADLVLQFIQSGDVLHFRDAHAIGAGSRRAVPPWSWRYMFTPWLLA